MKHTLTLLAVFIILLFALYTCNRCNPVNIDEPKIDTVFVKVKDSSGWYRPNITTIEPGRIPANKPKPESVDSFPTFEEEPFFVDTAAILKDYYSKVFYSDTTKTRYGNVIIKDTVTENRISARQVITDFNIPVITKTVTQPKRTQVYIGMNVQGMPTSPITAFGPSIMLKTKQDKVIELGALTAGHYWMYQASLKFKLSFKK
jgi:hypothetical protein